MDTANSSQLSVRKVAVANAVISSVALGFLVWLIYFHQSTGARSSGSILLPAINAALNSTSAALLGAGLFAIKQRDRVRHKRLMLAALVASSAFLVNYIVYHYTQGETRFAGTGAVRPLYFALLISHVVLSAIALPLILWTVFLALTERFRLHKAWAKWTWGIWMYVSVTGVIVFVMLHVVPWS